MVGSLRSRIQAGVASALVLGGLCGLAGAQDVAVEVQAPSQPKELRKVSVLMKSKVLIQQDQPAGQIVDVVLSEGGCIDYLVVDHNQQSYIVPYAAVQLRVPDRVVFVDIAPAQFQQVQYFPANSWPDIYAVNYRRNVFRTFNVDMDQNDNGRGRRETLKPIQEPDERRQRQDMRKDQREGRQNLRQDQREDGNKATPKDSAAAKDKAAPKDKAVPKGNAAPKDRPEVKPDPKPDRTKTPERKESSAPAPAADGQPGPRPGVIDPPGPKAPEATEAPKPEPRP